jgi:peroxiredoxin
LNRAGFISLRLASTRRKSIGASDKNLPTPTHSLSDPKADVIRRYDLLHRGAGRKGTDIARPAEFLIDSSGTIRWVNLTENIAVRARPEQVLKTFDETGGRTAH